MALSGFPDAFFATTVRPWQRRSTARAKKPCAGRKTTVAVDVLISPAAAALRPHAVFVVGREARLGRRRWARTGRS